MIEHTQTEQIQDLIPLLSVISLTSVASRRVVASLAVARQTSTVAVPRSGLRGAEGPPQRQRWNPNSNSL